MDLSCSIFLSISSNTRNWAFVRLNGKEFITSDICASLLKLIPLWSFKLLFFNCNKANCVDSNSSNTNLFLAISKSANSFGKCTVSIALFISSNLYSFNMYCGKVSFNPPSSSTSFKPFSIIFLIVFWDKLNVNGYSGIIFPVLFFFSISSNTGEVKSIFPYLLLIFPKKRYFLPYFKFTF